jgi:hypothetical protein
VTVAGEFAFASVNDAGHCVQAYLLKGTRLICGDTEIVLPKPASKVAVTNISDQTFHLDKPLKSPANVRGAYLLVGQEPRTGFEISEATEKTITVRDYPAIACDEATVLHSGWMQKTP